MYECTCLFSSVLNMTELRFKIRLEKKTIKEQIRVQTRRKDKVTSQHHTTTRKIGGQRNGGLTIVVCDDEVPTHLKTTETNDKFTPAFIVFFFSSVFSHSRIWTLSVYFSFCIPTNRATRNDEHNKKKSMSNTKTTQKSKVYKKNVEFFQYVAHDGTTIVSIVSIHNCYRCPAHSYRSSCMRALFFDQNPASQWAHTKWINDSTNVAGHKYSSSINTEI